MKYVAFAAIVLLTGCAHGGPLFRRRVPPAEARADSLYWSAIANLDPTNKSGTLDNAIANLDAYIAASRDIPLKHLTEAVTFRNLARSAQQLARVESALQQARASAASEAKPDTKARSDAETKGRDEEMVKEIQRLKDELAKANEELERIKKRLATPTKP